MRLLLSDPPGTTPQDGPCLPWIPHSAEFQGTAIHRQNFFPAWKQRKILYPAVLKVTAACDCVLPSLEDQTSLPCASAMRFG